jgi:Protein of unknown function (DUF3237)
MEVARLPSGAGEWSAGGTFTGPTMEGTLVTAGSADWQTVRPDGTSIGDIRYTLETNGGEHLAVFVTVGARLPGGVSYETYLVE